MLARMDQVAARSLGRDRALLFAGRAIRMFAYGFMAVVLGQYLVALGYSETWIGVLLTMTLVGDTAISLWLTTSADRFGRRKTLLVGAALMLLASVGFALTDNFWLLLLTATIGVISPSGNEVGPFLAVEQASLSHVIEDKRRTAIFAWYNLMGSFCTAIGAFAAGHLANTLQRHDVTALRSYQWVIMGYGLMGLAMAVAFACLSPNVEIANPVKKPGMWLGLHKSKRTVLKLSGLFSIDAFAGGFVIMPFVALWLKQKYPLMTDARLGDIFFGANILAGFSALSASWLAARIGLINTMVFTHLPSNVLLMLVPLAAWLWPENYWPAIGLLWARFAISQMDVPTRQSYTMAVVDPDERSAAAGVTGVARSVGAMAAPSMAGSLLHSVSFMSFPLYIGGGLKIVYDLLLYRSFQKHKPPEERQPATAVQSSK